MRLKIKENYHGTVIEIHGKYLGAVEGAAFKAALIDLLDAGKTSLVIDLSDTDLMDSTAIGTFIAGLASVRREGGDIRLANLKKKIKNLFLMTRLLGPVFEDYDTVEDALESYRPEVWAEG